MADEKDKAGALKSPECCTEKRENVFNFSSTDFDPLAALYAPEVLAPDENIEMYDNVEEFIRIHTSKIKSNKSSAIASAVSNTNTNSDTPVVGIFLDVGAEKHDSVAARHTISLSSYSPVEVKVETIVNTSGRELEEISFKATEGVKTAANESDSVPSFLDETTQPRVKQTPKRKVPRNVISQMVNGFPVGPLSLLSRCVAEKLKVHVWTRSVRNVRGISTGYIIAFDKHMNLALMDVDEVYRKPLGKHKKSSKKHTKAASVPRNQYLNEHDSNHYPLTQWQTTCTYPVSHNLLTESSLTHFDSCQPELSACLSATEEEVTSAFKGLHVFEESESTRLLGVKTRKLISRHLNQVLLRGDHVVAIAVANQAII